MLVCVTDYRLLTGVAHNQKARHLVVHLTQHLHKCKIAGRFSEAFSFQIQKNRESYRRSRLGDTVAVEALSPRELLGQYWKTIGLEEKEAAAMQTLAKTILAESTDQ